MARWPTRSFRQPQHAAPATQWRSRIRTTWAIVGVGVLVAAGAFVAGGVALGRHLSVPTPAPAPPLHGTTAFSATSPPTATQGSAPNPSAGPKLLAADFAQLQAKLHAQVGVVLTAVGGQHETVVLGDWQSGPAWSTIKVPLVIATLREQNPSVVTGAMTAAITESDNVAAESIWGNLGDPATAAAKVEAVLRETGDPTTVQSKKVRPEYTAFGQTDWSLVNQAEFISAAVCNGRNAPIFDLMGHIAKDQKWGLGNIPDAEFKGGWGPSTAGRYLVRQVGVIPTAAGTTAVAMAVEPAAGSFDEGAQELTELANWLVIHLAALPAGRCDS